MNQRFLFAASACLLVCCTAWSTPIRSIERLPHTMSPRPGQPVLIEQAGERWQARLPDMRTQALGEAMEDAERGRVAPLLLADFNFDGHTDLALVAGVGYGGAISTYWVHLWDDKAGQFQKFPRIIGNPTLEPARRALIAWERDGPAWTSTEYRSINGRLTLAVVREQNILGSGTPALDQLTIHLEDTGKVTDSRIVAGDAPTDVPPETLPSATAPITKAKVWLHRQPAATSRTGMYLVRGDTVTLQHYQPPKSERDHPFGWLFVRYQGRKVIELWIEADAIAR
jgi:hypothetical protein